MIPPYVCLHGHFYQPPRENPWLEEIERQDSAYPYHDWNERITAECYTPNTESPILGPDRRIAQLVNNYAQISFNMGPTLLSWLEKSAPETYEAILAADRESQKTFSGHGSALAQAYHHLILPLANSRDKETQILWGLRDFEWRFKRKPEGMWLPETAVDMETLSLLARHGIRFTILAPHQARRIRKRGTDVWTGVEGGSIDPKQAYLCPLPSGQSIALFFYDGPISADLAFGELLKSGEDFAQRLAGAFRQDTEAAQLVHVATDGETYGHHHRFGDMALAFALQHLQTHYGAKLTVYGEFLERFPPADEVEIIENSSWSCAHGVERWRSNCGCRVGSNPAWHQKWRASLRIALDALRNSLIPLFEKAMLPLLRDSWQARNDYIHVVLDRSETSKESFLTRQARKPLSKEERVQVWKGLEMQRFALLMYTSCGWFFDEISGLETVQILQYAARAIQLAEELGAPASLEANFVKILEDAPSNVPLFQNGANLYNMHVKPTRLNLRHIAAHYTVLSLFERDFSEGRKKVTVQPPRVSFPEKWESSTLTKEKTRWIPTSAGMTPEEKGMIKEGTEQLQKKSFCYTVEVKPSTPPSLGVLPAIAEPPGQEAGIHSQARAPEEFSGQIHIQSIITEEESLLSFSIQHRGRYEIIGEIDKYPLSLGSLFRDSRERIFNQLLDSALEEAEKLGAHLIEHYFSTTPRTDPNIPLSFPRTLSVPLEFILNRLLRRLLEADGQRPTPERLDSSTPQLLDSRTPGLLDFLTSRLLDPSTARRPTALDTEILSHVASQKLKTLTKTWLEQPLNLPPLESLEACLRLLKKFPLDLAIGPAQKACFRMRREGYKKQMEEKAKEGDKPARRWLELLTRLEADLYT